MYMSTTFSDTEMNTWTISPVLVYTTQMPKYNLYFFLQYTEK